MLLVDQFTIETLQKVDPELLDQQITVVAELVSGEPMTKQRKLGLEGVENLLSAIAISLGRDNQ